MLLLVAWLTGGCSPVPDYALPAIDDPGELPAAAAIAYRRLEIGDFRAPELPDSLRRHRSQLNAHTAVAIRTAPGASYSLYPAGAKGAPRTCGHLHHLRFVAVMLPEKSWWRPDLPPEKHAYVLQHEQIHFALMEVAARRLTRRSEMERGRLSYCAEDKAEVMGHLAAVVNGWLAESRTEVIREHIRFDRDTSARFVPEVQQRWFDDVSRELGDLAEWRSEWKPDGR